MKRSQTMSDPYTSEDDYTGLEKDPIEYNKYVNMHVRNIVDLILKDSKNVADEYVKHTIVGNEPGTEKFRSTVLNAVEDIIQGFDDVVDEVTSE